MKVSERGQVTIPKQLREQYGIGKHAEVEITATKGGLLIRKRVAAAHPVERVSGILGPIDVDRYVEEIRGR